MRGGPKNTPPVDLPSSRRIAVDRESGVDIAGSTRFGCDQAGIVRRRAIGRIGIYDSGEFPSICFWHRLACKEDGLLWYFLRVLLGLDASPGLSGAEQVGRRRELLRERQGSCDARRQRHLDRTARQRIGASRAGTGDGASMFAYWASEYYWSATLYCRPIWTSTLEAHGHNIESRS